MKDVRCLVGRHQWESRTNKDGQRYQLCTRAGCHRSWYPDDGRRWSPPAGADGGPAGAGPWSIDF